MGGECLKIGGLIVVVVEDKGVKVDQEVKNVLVMRPGVNVRRVRAAA